MRRRRGSKCLMFQFVSPIAKWLILCLFKEIPPQTECESWQQFSILVCHRTSWVPMSSRCVCVSKATAACSVCKAAVTMGCNREGTWAFYTHTYIYVYMYISRADQGEEGPGSSFQINLNFITKRKKETKTDTRTIIQGTENRWSLNCPGEKVHCSRSKTLKLQNKRQRRSSRECCPELETRQLIVWHMGGLDRGLNNRAQSRKSGPGDVIVCSWEPALPSTFPSDKDWTSKTKR